MTTAIPINPKLDRDSFLVKQQHRSWMKSKYHVYDDSGNELFYVERPVKVMQRSDITIYDDETGKTPVLVIRQEHGYAALHRVYDLIDPYTDEVIAHFDRNNIKSWLRRAWEITDHDGKPMAAAREDSPAIAAARRIFEWVPYAGIVTSFIRTNFRLYVPGGDGAERQVGTFNRKFAIGDKYALDLKDDPMRLLDRRVALALGILLDTGEAR
jgi:uncharacterized protein YxjI